MKLLKKILIGAASLFLLAGCSKTPTVDVSDASEASETSEGGNSSSGETTTTTASKEELYAVAYTMSVNLFGEEDAEDAIYEMTADTYGLDGYAIFIDMDSAYDGEDVINYVLDFCPEGFNSYYDLYSGYFSDGTEYTAIDLANESETIFIDITTYIDEEISLVDILILDEDNFSLLFE
ncbi:MAG: hypothetical protein ACI31G_02465 [Bacilli bacterium]